MGIWDRLGNVLKSYINDGIDKKDEKPFRKKTYDDDYDAAYDELESFLRGEKPEDGEKKSGEKTGQRIHIPAELKNDFAELGLPPDATRAECKEAYKRLLKIHHPDRHSGNPEKMLTATEKSARINASYDRLEKWFKAVG